MQPPASSYKVRLNTIADEKLPVSKFDWNKEILTTETIITDNYKNTENVRVFFAAQIGDHFYFTVEFMNWIKHHAGQPLSNAILRWEELREKKKDNTFKSEITSQLEYNRYIRMCLAANPELTLADAIKYWKLKRVRKEGRIYDKTDLDLK